MVPGRNDEPPKVTVAAQKEFGAKLLAFFTWSVSVAVLSRFCVSWFATVIAAIGAVISLFASVLLMLPASKQHDEDVNLVFVLAYVSLVFTAGAVVFPYYFFVFLLSAFLILGGTGALFALLVWLYGKVVKRFIKE